jgi:hypothetical protein
VTPLARHAVSLSLVTIVERAHPDAFYLITPIKGTPLEKALMRPGCAKPVQNIDPPLPADELSRLEKRFYEIDMGVAGDALLYLAPAAELMHTPQDPAIWMDIDYYQELRRRFKLRRGEELYPLSRTLPLYAAPPRQWTP